LLRALARHDDPHSHWGAAVSAGGGPGLSRAVRIVALLNLAYFGVEFAVAAAIGSVSLFTGALR